MATTDLVSLASLKAHLSISSAADAARDAALSLMITQISRAILTYINRPSIAPRVVTDLMSGTGRSSILLRNYPVQSVSALSVDGVVLPKSLTPQMGGWILDAHDPESPGSPQLLHLRDYVFPRGTHNISVTYLTGYMIVAESRVVSATVEALQPTGRWSSSHEVAFSDGQTLSQVSSSPAAGQYAVSSGVYTFSAADAGRTVLLSYGYVPSDLALAALDWAAYRWAARDRVGQTSKSIGGQETVSFTNEDIPAFVKMTLQGYMRVVP